MLTALDGSIAVAYKHYHGCATEACLDVFLPFDALGTWALIVEADTAKKAWQKALDWQQEIPTQYIAHVMKLLGTVPWNDYIKGLGSGLSIMDMAVFLS